MVEYQSKEFLALKREWDEKLKKSGFQDIETDSGNLIVYHKDKMSPRRDKEYAKLRHLPRNTAWALTRTRHYAVEEYYRMARHFLNDHKFSSRLHRLVFSLHSEGVSIRSIAKEVTARRKRRDSVNFKPLGKMVVETILKHLVAIMMKPKDSGL